jgi:hypothetical protein
LTITSIDGIQAKCNHKKEMGDFRDKITLTLFTGKTNEDDAIANTDAGDVTGDVNLSNVQADLAIIPGGNLRVAFLRGDDSNAASSADNNKLSLVRIGANGGLSENMITYRAEYIMNSGEFGGAGLTGAGTATNLDYKGSALDFGIGLNSPETSIGTISAWFNYLQASGDDNVRDDVDDSFHDFTIMAGANTSGRHYGEIFGNSNTFGNGGVPLGQGGNTSAAGTGGAVSAATPNTTTQGQGLEVMNIGATLKPTFAPKWWLRGDFYTFARGEDAVRTAAATVTQVGDKFGTEIDITLGHNHSDNVGIEFGYAMLDVDDAVTGVNGVNDDAVTKMFARTNIRWGGSND